MMTPIEALRNYYRQKYKIHPDTVITDGDLFEEFYEFMYEEDVCDRRWWTDVFRVKDLGGGVFIGYFWATNTGDSSLNDLGWEFDYGSLCFVEPYTVTVTRYRKLLLDK